VRCHYHSASKPSQSIASSSAYFRLRGVGWRVEVFLQAEVVGKVHLAVCLVLRWRLVGLPSQGSIPDVEGLSHTWRTFPWACIISRCISYWHFFP
jgi:hypothetical protein